MEAGRDKKTCKMCRMEIPKDARKCPFCHHFQNRVSMVMFHPAFAVVFACLPMLTLLLLFSTLLDRGEEYQRYRGQIAITDSQLVLGETKSGATVGVLGTITNRSLIPWKEIHFQVDFSDAKGRRTDAGQKEEYSYCLPAGESLSFKLSFRRELPETNYVRHAVRVVSAKDGRARW